MLKSESHLLKKLSDIAMVKLMYKYHIDTMHVVQLNHNQSIIQIINNTDETIYYTPQLSIGIVDIHSLGYYNVSKSVMLFDQRGNNRISYFPIQCTKFTPSQLL